MTFYFSLKNERAIKEARAWLKKNNYKFEESDGDFTVFKISATESAKIRKALRL